MKTFSINGGQSVQDMQKSCIFVARNKNKIVIYEKVSCNINRIDDNDEPTTVC